PRQFRDRVEVVQLVCRDSIEDGPSRRRFGSNLGCWQSARPKSECGSRPGRKLRQAEARESEGRGLRAANGPDEIVRGTAGGADDENFRSRGPIREELPRGGESPNGRCGRDNTKHRLIAIPDTMPD